MGMRITVTPKRQLIHYNLNEQYIAVSVFSAYGSMEYNIYNKKRQSSKFLGIPRGII